MAQSALTATLVAKMAIVLFFMVRSQLELLSSSRSPHRDFALHQTQYKLINMKFTISMIALTPAMESTKASLASW
jgi:hypothetical protein